MLRCFHALCDVSDAAEMLSRGTKVVIPPSHVHNVTGVLRSFVIFAKLQGLDVVVKGTLSFTYDRNVEVVAKSRHLCLVV